MQNLKKYGIKRQNYFFLIPQTTFVDGFVYKGFEERLKKVIKLESMV